jgi:hypothetical protein
MKPERRASVPGVDADATPPGFAAHEHEWVEEKEKPDTDWRRSRCAECGVTKAEGRLGWGAALLAAWSLLRSRRDEEK